MIKSYIAAWKKPFDFKSRSGRKEYWSFYFLNVFPFIFLRIIQSILTSISYFLIGGFSDPVSLSSVLSGSLIALSNVTRIFNFLLIFGVLWTTIPLTVRRIRDVGMSPKWIFLALVPYFGQIFQLIFLSRPSMISIGDKEYYLKYPTKKSDIWLICGLSFLVITLSLILILVK